MRIVKCLLGLGLVLGVFTTSHASMITWGSIQDATGNPGDVVTTGTLVDSATVFGSDVTVNGVTFNGVNNFAAGVVTFNNSSNITYGNVQFLDSHASAPGSWDTEYRKILSTAVGTQTDSAGPMTINLNGLTPGNEYVFQMWMPYWSLNWPTRFQDELGNSSGYLNNGLAAGTISDFITGSFIANATAQTIFAFGDNNWAVPASIQLRDVTDPPPSVPEPGTIILLGAGLAGLAARCRRRKSEEEA